MQFTNVFNRVLMLLFIIIIGFYAKKRGILNEDVNKKLSELLLKITAPFLALSAFQFHFSRDIFNNVAVVFVFAVSAHLFTILLGMLLYRKYPDDTKKILKFITIYSNCGYMGFPILEGIYGKTGVLYGSLYVAAFNIFLWTNGVMIFSGNNDLRTFKKAMINPGITSVALGMLIFLFSIDLPAPLSQTLETVGSMTTPVSMLIVGSVLADINLRNMFKGFELYYAALMRLLIIPLVTFFTLKLTGFNGMLLEICVLLVAMPAAASTALFSEMYGGDSALASRIVAFTTILSIITIPLVIILV